jgi:glycine/D-amino acid oxidase-like deaminating enzyme
MPTLTADAVIVGAGFAGTATARHLVRAGVRRVVLLEREPTPGRHASGLNAGMARQNSIPERLLPLAVESVAALRHATSDEGIPLFRRTGSLILGDAAAAPGLREGTRAMRAAGLGASWLDAAAVGERMPLVRDGDFEGGVYCPDDGVVEIGAALQHLLRLATTGGTALLTGQALTGVEVAGGRVRAVLTDRQRIETPVVVNAAGAWAGAVGALAGGVPVPLRPCRRHLVLSGPVAGLDPEGPFVWDVSHEVYFRPERPGLLLSPCDEDEWEPGDVAPDPGALELLARKLADHYPRLVSLEPVRSWAGLRTLTPDGGFAIGRDPRVEGLIWCAGLGGHGMTVSHAAGRLAAEAVCGGAVRPSCDPARFDTGTRSGPG